MLSTRSTRPTASALILFGIALTAGCGGFFTKPVLKSITVGPSAAVLGKGSTLQLTATGLNDDSSTSTLKNVTWSSSSDAIATVNASGLLTGVSTGTANITATSGSITGTTTVNVLAANITSITVSPANPVLAVGQQITFTATGNLANGTTVDLTTMVTWVSSNTNVATITSSGVATAVQGASTSATTTISATAGQVSGSTTLTIAL